MKAGRGGLAPFLPGDHSRFVFPKKWGGSVRPANPALPGTVCEVELPCRLHASVLDMNCFDLGRPGGGGIGFGINLTCSASIGLTDSGALEVEGNRPRVAEHFGELFRVLCGYRGGLAIRTLDHGRRHMGLGSSIATTSAVAIGLNEAFGRPLSLRDLRKLIANNYCEEAPGDAGKLVAGFETNVGAMVGIHGGMVVASDTCELVYRVPLPDRMKALLVLPGLSPNASSGKEEAEALLGKARARDLADREHKAYRVLMELLPAMIRGDFAGVGDVLYDLAFKGSKNEEIRLHGNRGEEILSTMELLKGQGAEVVCMSSVGPAVFALSAKPKVWARWKPLLKPESGGGALALPIDNLGARVRLDGVVVPYRIEPWWHKP